MIRRPHRVTFRMKPEEQAALKALAVRSRAWDDSKAIRLALSVLCMAMLHELPDDSPALHFRSISAQSILERYRVAYLSGKADKPAKSDIPGELALKKRKRVPQKPSARFKGIPVR